MRSESYVPSEYTVTLSLNLDDNLAFVIKFTTFFRDNGIENTVVEEIIVGKYQPGERWHVTDVGGVRALHAADSGLGRASDGEPAAPRHASPPRVAVCHAPASETGTREGGKEKV